MTVIMPFIINFQLLLHSFCQCFLLLFIIIQFLKKNLKYKIGFTKLFNVRKLDILF